MHRSCQIQDGGHWNTLMLQVETNWILTITMMNMTKCFCRIINELIIQITNMKMTLKNGVTHLKPLLINHENWRHKCTCPVAVYRLNVSQKTIKVLLVLYIVSRNDWGISVLVESECEICGVHGPLNENIKSAVYRHSIFIEITLEVNWAYDEDSSAMNTKKTTATQKIKMAHCCRLSRQNAETTKESRAQQAETYGAL